MKVNCWDKCFLCLTNFGSTSSSSCGGESSRRQKQKQNTEKQNTSALIKYLLETWGDQSQNESLLQRIRQLQPSNSTSSEGFIKFCDKCQDSAKRFSNLQMELEAIQMKIVDILCSVRKTVIGNSNGHHDGTSGMSFEEFTKESREVLDTVRAFQAAVVEKSKETAHLPLVYIEKFTGCSLKTNWAAPIPTVSVEDEDVKVKTEPEADTLEEIFSDLGDDIDSFDYHHPVETPINRFDEGMEGEEGMDTINDANITTIKTTPGHVMFAPAVPLASPPRPRKLQKLRIEPKKTKRKTDREKEKFPTKPKRGTSRKNLAKGESSDTIGGTCSVFLDDVQPPNIKEEPTEVLSLSSEPDANPVIKEENCVDGTRKARSPTKTASKRIADDKKLSRTTFQHQPRKVSSKARKNKETDTKSSPSNSQNPTTKILLSPVPKTGKRMNRTTSKKPGKKSKSKDKLYACEICSFKTHKTVQFDHHLREHETPEIVNHICPHCTNPTRQFSQKQSFDYHMSSHAGHNKMACDLCPKFIDPIGILEHVRGHSDVEKIFQCSCCSYFCGTREGYLDHIRYHGRAALICDVCSKKFHSRTRMLEHMHKEHNVLEKIKCDVANCDKEFLESSRLATHKKRHFDSEAFFCSECNVQFPTARILLAHQVRDHAMEKPHPCVECSEKFFNKSALVSHQIRAHGAAKLKCQYCPSEFANQKVLAAHMNLHEGISFACDNCNKVFGDRQALKSHQVVHKTTKDLICEECGKAFRHESLLRSHVKIHIGDKRHKCSYCPKAFVIRQNLICHERIHTGERPYVCEACGKDFIQRSALNLHFRTHHKELIANSTKQS